MATPAVLPETAAVYWRPRVDAARLRRIGRLWTLTTVAHVVPFVLAGAVLIWLEPLGGAGRARLPRARLGDPGALRVARRERHASRPAGRCAGREHRARPPRRPRRPRRARPARPHGRRRRAWAPRDVGGRRVRRAARPIGWAPRGLLVRARPTTRSCPRPTASPISCSRCAPTSRASPRWPTWRSPGRADVCGAGCRRQMRPALDVACGRASDERSRPVLVTSATRAIPPGGSRPAHIPCHDRLLSRSRLVLLQAAARPTASPDAGPQPAKIRRYRLARAHLQAQRTQQLAVAHRDRADSACTRPAARGVSCGRMQQAEKSGPSLLAEPSRSSSSLVVALAPAQVRDRLRRLARDRRRRDRRGVAVIWALRVLL